LRRRSWYQWLKDSNSSRTYEHPPSKPWSLRVRQHDAGIESGPQQGNIYGSSYVGLNNEERTEEDRICRAFTGASVGPEQGQQPQDDRENQSELPHFPGGQRNQIHMRVVLIGKPPVVHAGEIPEQDATQGLAGVPAVAQKGIDTLLL